MNTGIDWTDLSGWVSTLDKEHRSQLWGALRHAEHADIAATIVAEARRVIAEEAAKDPEAPLAVAVIFESMDFDNGYFISDPGTVRCWQHGGGKAK